MPPLKQPLITPGDPTHSDSRALGYALLAAGMALVGTYVALSRPLTAAFPVFLLAWLRFGIAAVAMIPWTAGRAGDPPLTRRQWGGLFTQSFFGNFLFSICMLAGVSMTSASAAGVVLAMLPAAVALLSWAFLRERLDGHTWAAVALAVAGVAILSMARETGAVGSGAPGTAAGGDASRIGETHATLIGPLLLAGSVACEAVYVIIGKRLTASLSPMRISALINLFGLALMTPFGLAQALSFDFGSVGGSHWSLLVFYSLSASMFSTWLWLSGQKRVPASHSGVFTIAMPLAASLVGVLALGERPGLAHGVALACAAGGIALIARPRRR